MTILTNPARRCRALLAVAGTILVTSANAVGPTADAAGTPSTAAFCILTPAAETMPLGPELVGTMRTTDSEIEVLHRVECDGATIGWKWLTPRDILEILDQSTG
jgi:hypothetical protein